MFTHLFSRSEAPSWSQGHDGPHRSLRRRKSQPISSTWKPRQVPYLPENLWKPKSRASLIAQLVKIRLHCRRPRFDPWVGKISWRRDWPPTPVFLGFFSGSAGKESACNAGDPGSGRSPGEGKCYPLQYSGLENSMGCTVHGVAKSWTQQSGFHFGNQGLEKAQIPRPHPRLEHCSL